MLFAVAAIVTAGPLLGQPQSTAAPRPLVQLLKDLDVSVPRAQLSDTQRSQIQSDREVIEAARQAKQQGQPVKRRQVGNAVKNLHELIESGAFSAQDRQMLNDDIELLRKQ